MNEIDKTFLFAFSMCIVIIILLSIPTRYAGQIIIYGWLSIPSLWIISDQSKDGSEE